MPPCVPAWSTCQRVFLRAYQCSKSASMLSHFYVPTSQWTCQCTKRRANLSDWCVNMPKNVPIFQTFLFWNAKGNFYTLFLYKKFYIILGIILISYAHKNCIILNFRTSCHLKEMFVDFLFYETFLLFRKTWFLYVTSAQGFLELSTKTIKAKCRIRVNIVTILNWSAWIWDPR